MSKNLSETHGFFQLVVEFLSFPTFIAQPVESRMEETTTEALQAHNDDGNN